MVARSSCIRATPAMGKSGRSGMSIKVDIMVSNASENACWPVVVI